MKLKKDKLMTPTLQLKLFNLAKLKHLLGPLTLAAMACIALAPQGAFAQYINLTIGGQLAPGFYGELAIGNNPLPPVLNNQPLLLEPSAYNAPIAYIYAPAQHINNWRFYCAQYNACQRAVFFVRVEEQNPWWERRFERGPMPENTYIWERERRMERPGEFLMDRRHEERHEDRREERREERPYERGPERR